MTFGGSRSMTIQEWSVTVVEILITIIINRVIGVILSNFLIIGVILRLGEILAES